MGTFTLRCLRTEPTPAQIRCKMMAAHLPAVRWGITGTDSGIYPKPRRSVPSFDDTSCPEGVDPHGEGRRVDSQSGCTDLVGMWRRGIVNQTAASGVSIIRSRRSAPLLRAIAPRRQRVAAMLSYDCQRMRSLSGRSQTTAGQSSSNVSRERVGAPFTRLAEPCPDPDYA